MVSLKQPPRRAARKPISVPEPMPPEPVVADAAPPAPPPPEDEPRRVRGERIPISSQRQRLVADERPGFVRRWVNEEGGRIRMFEDAGYTHVKDTGGVPRQMLVGTAKIGGGLTAYLMEIPEEYYQEDMLAKDERARKFDKDIRRGHGPGTAPGEDGRYVPMKPDGTPRIEIKESVRRGIS